MKNFTLKSKQGFTQSVENRDTRKASVQNASRFFTAGFTLIETLFAVLLFTTSLVALMAVAGRGIASNTTAREDLVARYLALEGLEAVRNIRDTNYISTTNAWDLGLTSCSNGCDIDYLPEPVMDAGLDSQPLFVDIETGVYGHDPSLGTITPFYRSIEIDSSSGPDELKVVSRVEWQSKSVQRSVEYVDYLKKWR